MKQSFPERVRQYDVLASRAEMLGVSRDAYEHSASVDLVLGMGFILPMTSFGKLRQSDTGVHRN